MFSNGLILQQVLGYNTSTTITNHNALHTHPSWTKSYLVGIQMHVTTHMHMSDGTTTMLG